MNGVLRHHLHHCLKQCIFCFVNANESMKHKLWDCIHAWRLATFIMHGLSIVQTSYYDKFHWKRVLFMEKAHTKLDFHLASPPRHYSLDLMDWKNDKMFNQVQWHETKGKFLIWDAIITCAKLAWARVVKYVKISLLSGEALLHDFHQTWRVGGVLCKCNNF